MPFAIDIPADTSPAKRANVESLIAQWKRVAETKAILRKPEMRSFSGYGATKLDDALASGEIPSFMLGGHRVTAVDLFFQHLIARALASPGKADKAGVRFKKKLRRREITEAERQALARANEARHQAAVARRRVKAETQETA